MKHTLIFLWWFMMMEGDIPFPMVGPFGNRATCESIRATIAERQSTWVVKTWLSPCWTDENLPPEKD